MATSGQKAHKKRPIAGANRTSGKRFTRQANAVSKDIEGMGAIAKDVVHDALEECQENAAAAYEEGREKVQEVARTLERYIAEQPLTSVLIATGVGLFLGRFWKRR